MWRMCASSSCKNNRHSGAVVVHCLVEVSLVGG